MRLSIRQPNPHQGSQPFLRRLQSNLGLKLVSLGLSLLLYFYVQAEHNLNPQITVPLRATVQVRNAPSNILFDTSNLHPLVHVTGPRILVENMRDGDVTAEVDLAGQAENTHVAILPAHYTIPTLKPDVMDQIHIDGPPTLRIPLYARVQRTLPIHVVLPPPPPGYTYQSMRVAPDKADVSGREDYVDSVARLEVYPSILAAGVVRGDFPVQAVDKLGNTVPDVQISPHDVHVSAILVAEPSSQVAIVCPIVKELPLPPYRLVRIEAQPPQIQLRAAVGGYEGLSLVNTEPIDLHDLKSDTTLNVKLALPKGVNAYTLQGQLIQTVVVRVSVVKEAITAPPSTAPEKPPTPPATPGG